MRWVCIIGVLAFGVLGEWQMALATPLGYYLGAFVDPDMDLPNANTYAKALWRKTRVLAWMVSWWNLYGLIAQAFLGGHRSILTHTPGLATSLRLVWLMLPFTLLWVLVSPQPLPPPGALRLLAGILFGLTISDTVHVTADILWR